MRLRYIAYTLATIALLNIGWYAHAVAYYVQDIKAKAEMCDKIDCYAVAHAADTMLANGLPVVK